ncbi:hypothetical protein C0Q70_03032 [Pomacea canaliculata]|uniref:DUF4587 domain-containing protein n=1 Tax=Pomacea canaliculata TaxID=400727 RepID=A0A2T7PRK6_POMCA|nr:hypothetical protein C0Q70_03032 [Pomacea canaliculata]
MEDDDDELLSELAFTLEEDQDEKLAQEREKLQRSDSASSNEYDSQVKLQQAMLRRQELLDKIRQEQLLNDEERRPRTYTPRRRYTPSPLPPPSRRSLPDLNRNYHFNWYTKRPRVSDMAVSKHVIEHQFRPMESKTYTVLPPISTNAQVVPQVSTTEINMFVRHIQKYKYTNTKEAPLTHCFSPVALQVHLLVFLSTDFMDMMMLQNAQMHHMVMQQMMLQNLPGGGYRMPTATVPLAPVVEPAVSGSSGGHVLSSFSMFVPPSQACGGRLDCERIPLPTGQRISFQLHLVPLHKRLHNKGNRPSSVFLFGIILKEIVAALHRVYLNPSGNIYPVMGDIIGSGAQDLSQLVGERGRVAEDESVRLFQILQYVMENLIYHITEIMPKTGVLGTHKKAAVFELIKNGKRFPDGYFWQIELDRLQFNNNGRTMNVGDKEAFLLLVGMFLSRSLITTLLMKPVDYGLSTEQLTEVAERNLKVLSTVMLFLVRRVSTPPDAPMMPMPGEVARYVFSDEEMRNVHLRLRRSYEYCENLLREWGAEYIRRLRDAAVNSTKK